MAKAKAENDKHTWEVACPECGGVLRIDGLLRAVVSHTPAPRKRTFDGLEDAAKALRAGEERKESLFRQAVDAEKHKDDLLERRFAEAVKKAKETPGERVLREFDLD
jgi:hypothetical protein